MDQSYGLRSAEEHLISTLIANHQNRIQFVSMPPLDRVSTTHYNLTDEHVLVAFETLQHTYLLGTCHLPVLPEEQMVELRRWLSSAAGRWDSATRRVLCKKRCIKIGVLEVGTWGTS